MKHYMFLMLCLLCAVSSVAQSSAIATLSHEGTLTSYQGIDALCKAYSAAKDGDVITLSSGEFNAPSILTKSLTIRGAGCDINIESGRLPTYVIGVCKIGKDGIPMSTILEGIYFNGQISYAPLSINKLQIIKSRLPYLQPTHTVSSSTHSTDISIIQCKITHSIKGTSTDKIHLLNSYIGSADILDTYAPYYQFDNCVVFGIKASLAYTFYNCILSAKEPLSVISKAINCIAIGESTLNTFDKIHNSTNSVISGYEMFNSFKGEIDEETEFSLTDEAKTKYLGTDGTEVGMYGGALPYETTPNNPQITTFKVASKSTADGKLSVDISVAVPE